MNYNWNDIYDYGGFNPYYTSHSSGGISNQMPVQMNQMRKLQMPFQSSEGISNQTHLQGQMNDDKIFLYFIIILCITCIIMQYSYFSTKIYKLSKKQITMI